MLGREDQGKVSGVSYAAEGDGTRKPTCSGINSFGSGDVGKVMPTAQGVSPKKANENSALGQNYPSRQCLPVAGSRIRLPSYLGQFHMSQSHFQLVTHNEPETENHSEEGW